jgi:isopentenyl diphosphate isomerase/L-lactate dehydrogenase-like FMN-dependent dehydrogenase
MGGLGTSSTFKANIEALGKIRFNMRTMHDVSEPDTSTELLGFKLDLPLFAAPIGGVSFNMGGKITEDEYISAILKGCVSKGLIGCTGDGVPEFIHQSAFKAIREVEGNAIPFIKPWESEEFEDKLAKALDAGAKAFGMDIDAAGLITLKKMGRPVTPKGKEKLAEIISRIPVPFVLKGIMTADEALMAAEAGAAGIVVSNHGGRVLDHCPGTAEVLAEISRAVNGKCSVIVDGGIRDGNDILKMLALGADAVMIGRPFSVAAVGGLQEGVEKYIDQLKSELTTAMVLTGTASAKNVDSDILRLK